MPPRLPEDVVPIVRALLEGNHAAADALLKSSDAQQWCPCGSEVLGDRTRLAGQAAALLAALRQHNTATACRLFLLVGVGVAAGLAVQHRVPLFDSLQQLAGKYGAGTGGHINRSAASFHQAGADVAEAVRTVATCGAETMTVLFEPELAGAQGDDSYKVKMVLKRSEYFRVTWHTLQQPVSFSVQPDGSCRLDSSTLPLDGSRRLVEAVFGDQTYTIETESRDTPATSTKPATRTKFSLPPAANAAPGQTGSIARFCTLDTAGTYVMLFRLDKMQRVFSDAHVDEMVGPAELGQLLDGLGLTAEQLGIGQPQPLLDPLVQQVQQAQHQLGGATGARVPGVPPALLPLGAGLPPGIAGGLLMPQLPASMAGGPAMQPAALLATQQAALLAAHQAALLASQQQQAAAASVQGGVLWPSAALPLGSVPFTSGFLPHPVAFAAAGGVAAPAPQPAAGVLAAGAPAVEAAATGQPAGTVGGVPGGSYGGSAGSSSSEIAHLEEAQSATEEARQLMAEDFERMGIKVDEHGEQISGLRKDVDTIRAQLSGTVEPAAVAAEEEEVSSQPGKRRRSHAAAAASARPAASTAVQPAPATGQPAAAAPQPGAAPMAGGTVLPSDAEVQQLLLEELLDTAESRDKLQLCRALKEQLNVRISSVGDLTRVVNRVLTGLLRDEPPRVEKLAPREGDSKPLWKRIN